MSFLLHLLLSEIDVWDNRILLIIPVLITYALSHPSIFKEKINDAYFPERKPPEVYEIVKNTLETVLRKEAAASFSISADTVSNFNKFKFPSIEEYFIVTEEVNQLDPKSSNHSLLNQGKNVVLTEKMRIIETGTIGPLLDLLNNTIIEVIENPEIFNSISKENISVSDYLRILLQKIVEETCTLNNPEKTQFSIRPHHKSLSCSSLNMSFPLFEKLGPKFRILLSVVGVERDVLVLIKFQKESQKKIIKQLLKDQDDNNLFLASIVHDLRSPLIGIVYMIEAAVEKLRQEEIVKQLKIAISNCQLLSCLIDDILDFTSSKNNKFRIVLSHFYLNDLINEVITIMKPDADLRNLVLEYLSPIPYDMRMNSDPKRLKQVLINLISNALKFTSNGFVHVTAWKVDDYIIEIHVIDTGTGIKKDTISSLSTPYMTIDNETGTNKRGIGLGLHNCKQILSFLGPGGLNIKSREGEGSDFGFKIFRDVHNPTSELLSCLISKKEFASVKIPIFQSFLIIFSSYIY